MVEQIFKQFCESAKSRGYHLQPPEDSETQEVKRQTVAMGLDPDIYQTLVVYVVGQDKYRFAKTFFSQKKRVAETKEELFGIVCSAMKNQKDTYAFLKHYREFIPWIQEQLQIPGILAQAHPHVNSHALICLEEKQYVLPNDEDKLPLAAYSLDAERLIVGFKYCQEFGGAGKIILFDSPSYGILVKLPPRRIISIDNLV